ncbi:MAG TPA: DUF4124 domain-containing protein, partial [Marinagarivorans sp.]
MAIHSAFLSVRFALLTKPVRRCFQYLRACLHYHLRGLKSVVRCLWLLSSAGAICTIGALAQADIYQWTDANGKVHYTDRPNDTAVAKAGGTVTKIETKVNTFEPV